MDSVMINQLPELVIPRNRTFLTSSKMTVVTAEKRNPYLTKWYVLFDNRNDNWISFQPKAGVTVYPCYVCRDMFGSRNSFLDHVNRRGLVLKYNCSACKKLSAFYNTCSFLLHVREHFTDTGGKVDLDKVDISTIPMDIAGFMPISNVPRLYDTKDDSIDETLKINSKFFKPTEDSVGKRYVYFNPIDLVFFCMVLNAPSPSESTALILKQVNKNIPKCIFVSLIPTQENTQLQQNQSSDNDSEGGIHTSEDDNDDEVICLDDDEDSNLKSSSNNINNNNNVPKIQVKNFGLLSKSKSLAPPVPPLSNEELWQKRFELDKIVVKCPECKIIQTVLIKDHFQEISRPLDEKVKCKKCGLISPSICSLQAHIRIHDKESPFICPECGEEFDVWNDLNLHMENICFHTAKTVRFKCPAKKCGKVFAQTSTFSSHFPIAHMKVRFSCELCQTYFTNEIDYNNHLQTHETKDKKACRIIHECTVCLEFADDIKQHVIKHVQNRYSRIYVYICKYCRSYYRSKQTYAAHLLRCTKLLLNNQVKKEVEQIESHNDMRCRVVKFCKPCNSKIQFHCTYKDIKNVETSCPKCQTPFESNISLQIGSDYEYTDNLFIIKDLETEHFECILCDKVLAEDERSNYVTKHKCKYQYPVVKIEKNISLNDYCYEYNDSFEEESQVSPSSDDSAKRKRKRIFTGPVKNKKSNLFDKSQEILVADPVLFDGEYKCNLCSFKNQSRKLFHEHIQQHRDISTSYQCMECGECFVVKPSLLKHLQVFHMIEDVENYMNENDCYDKEAVKILEEHMRMVPGEVTELVSENQCKICRQIFPDGQELSKHFRVHGMAFLMKKIIK